MSEWQRLGFFGLGFALGSIVTVIVLEVLLAIA